VRIYRWTAVAVGFAGVLLIIFDYAAAAGSGAAQPERSLQGVALQLGAAFFGALAGIQIRRLSRTESAPTIVLYFTLFCTLAALVTVPFGWAMPSPRDAVILVVMGLFGGLGQVLMTQSFRYAEASVLAPFDYLSMIWALAVSIAIFDSLPTPLMLAGTAIVVASGLFVVYRERQLGLLRQRARQVQPPPPPLT
jgi:drug/metabolite transporter (DMT)-like permease